MIRERINRALYSIHFWRFHIVHLRSRKAIETWQAKRLARLIGYIAVNIPLYKKLLADASIEASSIRSVGDLARLPIIKKTQFIGTHVDEYTDASAPLFGTWATTSGSTGTPFSPLRRAIARMPLYTDSLRYRFITGKQWFNVTLDWARVAHFRIFPVYRKNHLVVPVEDILNSPEKALAATIQHAPHIIDSYPSAVLEFARFVTSQKSSFTVPYVLTTGEKMSPLLRSTIENALGCELFDRYGLEEFGTVASECDRHDGYHINVESFIVEIVDQEGDVVPEGEFGRILITDLYNLQMPFVRYDTGDHGRISWEKCACGLEAMRLWIEGRESSVITLSLRGRKFHHFEFSESLKSFMNRILQFQIEKSSEESIVVRIVPGPLFNDETEDEVREHLAELVGEGATVSVELVPDIKKMPRGKIQVVLDLTAS